MSVSVSEPFSSNISNLPRKLVGSLLTELDHKVTVMDVYPIQDQGKEVDDIAEALEQYRCGPGHRCCLGCQPDTLNIIFNIS